MQQHFLGLRTVIYPAQALTEARDWYTRALGFPPYFDQPFYVGFNVGGYELGLDPDAAPTQGGGTQAYWGVADIDAAVVHLQGIGAVMAQEIQDVGDNVRVAMLTDPFGNLFGIIQNPHFELPTV
jgi:predicted enzyme related to lactoylglutathione lyase